MDIKDIIGGKIIGGIEGGRTTSFAALTIQLKNGRICHVRGKTGTNLEVIEEQLMGRNHDTM